MSTSLPLRHLGFGWFSMVMGLCGLSLAWYRAAPHMGPQALMVSWVVGALGVLVFGLLLLASLLRAQRHTAAVVEDLAHPVRHPFAAALPISMMLVATVWVQHDGPGRGALALWVAGSVLQFAATVWVLARWLRGNQAQGLGWLGITPLLFIPVVGNVVAPLGGVALGLQHWSMAQAAVGLMFWPVLLTLLMVRIGMVGMWPPRLLPATFITVAPPAVGGLALLQLGMPHEVAWAAWGCALFFLCWSSLVVPAALGQPFSLAFWGLSFPLAAFTALSLRLSESSGGVFAGLALGSLAVTSLVIAALFLATLKGLRRGTLLVPEVVPISNAANAASAASDGAREAGKPG